MINSPAWGLVRGIEPMSLCDWPGRLSAVVFFGGCNLRCPHCHNAALAWTPEAAPPLAEKAVRRFVDSHKRWLDGLVVTGGEPTLVPGLPGFAVAIAASGLPVTVDSNGLRPDVLAALLAGHPDIHLAVDVKAPFAKYPLVTGGAVSAETARRCLGQVFALAAAHPGRIRFRTTRVPELTEADLREVKSAVPAGHALALQPFRPNVRHGEERHDAQADTQTRRLSGDVVHPAHCPGDPKGPQGQRHPGSAARHPARGQG